MVQAQAKLELAEAAWKRAQTTQEKAAISEPDIVTARSNYKVAKASVTAAEAAHAQKKAVLKEAQLKLSYTTIKSPVVGVIIDRRVNVGQMTSVGPNAPSLFLIAKDLRRIQVWASVNEADVGRIHVGMPVSFTVATYPGKTFRGKVTQIRLNATMTQNVVTYTVVIGTDNADGRLLPYLTAQVQFE